MSRASMVGVRRSPLVKIAAAVASLAVLVTLAIVAHGYEVQEVPRVETSVWVARDGGQYARVNTDLAEIDTVREVEEPTAVVQSGTSSVVFTQGYRQFWPVDPATPVDLVPAETADADAEPASDDSTAPAPAGGDAQATPAGTRVVVAAGGYVGYLTDTGKVFVSTLGVPDGAQPSPVAPADADGAADEGYAASAIGVSAAGDLVMYSAGEGAIRRFDVASFGFVGSPTVVPDAPDAEAELELALVGERWVLGSASDGLVWVEGLDVPVETGLAGARLQSSAEGGEAVHLTDAEQLVAVSLDSGAVTTLAEAAGVPAAPVVVDGTLYAAWLTADSGSLWSSDRGEVVRLAVDGDGLQDVQSIVPVFHSNGQRAVLAEVTSGMLWTLPDGTLIPLAQWSIDDEDTSVGTVEVDDVARQEPPVAVADVFGVRSGQLVSLPVLLNDHDANKRDVLSIRAASVAAGLADPSFGQLSIVSNNQAAAVRVNAQGGSTTFNYAVTDGMSDSPPATVTLTVVPDDVNTAPVWCGVAECRQEWPTPQVAPGGTVTVPVLGAWVDPEGDAVVLTDARLVSPDAPVSVVATADGRVAIRHNDPNASEATIPITVTVADSRGAVAEKELVVTVSARPALEVTPVVLVAAAGEKAQLSIADSVSGGSGSYRLLDAVDTGAAGSGLVVVPNAAAGTVELTASAAGDYVVTYSVQDAATLAEQSAIVRLTVVDGGAPLAVAPLTAFVRPNVDTTVDVLGAVQNSTGRVLVVTEAVTADPGLSVSVVGQSRVRVSGSTLDGGPGLVGTADITITDGADARVQGQVQVFLVPGTTDTDPIAVPDTVTVRAGDQIDIPVLANDFSPRGERLLVHPQVEGSGAEGELAFAGETTVRYLAPEEAGTVVLRYTAHLEGRPERMDTSTITVTVLPTGANRAPQPPILTARAIAGQPVSIPVRGFAMDPDGDSVVLAGVENPEAGHGVASISADGGSIVYQAPAAGVPGGQVSFAYTVRDASGASADGAVRVGVVSSAVADVTPITYSDYVRVQAGADVPVTVSPLADDRDPAGGELELVALEPNAPGGEGNPEFDRLQALVDAETSLEEGRVVLRAGEVQGTHSYVYTVQSKTTTSTAQGFIVVDVTAGSSPEAPIVTDTVLTAKDRKQLAQGIDVVTGKVRWASGDVADLSLSLVAGGPGGFSTSGATISGAAPSAGALVPFSLRGEDAAGTEVTTYGFLRIPAFDDMRVQVRADIDPVTVGEEQSVTFEVAELLDLESGDTVEVDRRGKYVAQRANAACAPAGGGGARYDAGREAPWVDTCTIPVRLDGQQVWTFVSIPLEIEPKDPHAILTPATRTIAPGASETIDLYGDLTTWEGGREGDASALDFATSFVGTSFTVTQSGTTVTVDAHADARPGTRETIQVSTTSFGGLRAGVVLIVGVAPVDAPRGATFSHSCDVSKGATCAITVTGLSGEYDPFAGRTGAGLTLSAVGSGDSVACPIATVTRTSDSQVAATWPSGPKPAGGTCVVPFTVEDAQGRTGPGQLTIDVQGYPHAPATVSTIDYSASTVTLSVPLGEAAQAHPAIAGVSLWEGGSRVQNASCAPGSPGAYTCVVTGLSNGARHQYTARAENSVGQSLDTTPHETWAYDAPRIANIEATPKYDAADTTETRGVVTLRITSDADAKAFTTSNGQRIPRSGTVTTEDVVLPIGTTLISLTPESQFAPPIGDRGSLGSNSDVRVEVIGKPIFSGAPSPVWNPDASTLTISGLSLNLNGAPPAEYRYLAWHGGSAPTCSFTGGSLNVSGGGGSLRSSSSATIEGIEANKRYSVMVCAATEFGFAVTESARTATFRPPAAPPATSYTVSTDFKKTGNVYTTRVTASPSFPNEFPWGKVIRRDGVAADFALDPEVEHKWSAAYCLQLDEFTQCSEETLVTPTAAPTTTRVEVFANCVDPTADDVVISAAARGSAVVTFAESAPRTDDRTLTYSVTWTGSFAGQAQIDHTVDCDGIPVAPPDPPEPSDPPVTPPGGPSLPPETP